MVKHSKELRKLLLQYFQCVSSGQNVLQCIKQTLFLHKQFNPLLLFELISKGKQIQTKRDWRNHIFANDLQCNQQQINILFSHHKFGQQVRFNEFIQMLMPFNGDVTRIFRKNYLLQLQITDLDQEVQSIFKELIKFWLKFFKNVLKIRKQLSCLVQSNQISELVKQDLVNENKNRANIRQSVKYKEKFQSGQFQLTFHELRRFLQLWLPSESTNIEFQLLQIKRYLRNDYPFRNVYLRPLGSQSKGSPLKRRANSSARLQKSQNQIPQSQKKENQYTNAKPKQRNFEQADDRFKNYKLELLQQLQSNKLKIKNPDSSQKKREQIYRYNNSGFSSAKQRSDLKKETHVLEPRRLSYDEEDQKQQYIRQLRYQRNQKCIDGTLIIQILQEIAKKQQILEKERKKLAGNHDFNLINLFKLIDWNNKGYITEGCIQTYLNRELPFNQLLIYHCRQKGRMRFQDFCLIFRPLSKKLNEILDEKPQNVLPNPFKRQTLTLISSILILSAQMFYNIHEMKKRINDEGIEPKMLFSYVDVKDKGYIQSKDIQDLLEEKNIECDPRDLKCIMKVFRKRVNEKINLRQFQAFIDL